MKSLYRRAGEVNASFIHDFKFDQLFANLKNCPYPVLIRPDLSRKLERSGAYLSKRCVCDSGAQCPITIAIGAKEIDIGGFAILFQFQDYSRASAKKTAGAAQKVAIQSRKGFVYRVMANAGIHDGTWLDVHYAAAPFFGESANKLAFTSGHVPGIDEFPVAFIQAESIPVRDKWIDTIPGQQL